MTWTKEDQKRSDSEFRDRRRARNDEEIDTPERKVCSKCLAEKISSEFANDKVTKDGLRFYCRACEKLENDKWKIQNWHEKLLHSAKSTSKKYNLPFDLDEKFIMDLWNQQIGKCYWLGIDLIPSAGRSPSSPSIDRVDCDGGYTKDNIVLCSQFANLGRCDVDAKTFKEFCGTLKSMRAI